MFRKFIQLLKDSRTAATPPARFPPVPPTVCHSAEEVAEKVREFVAKATAVPIERVTPEARFEVDIGHSMAMVEVVMLCEEEFGLDIPDGEAEQCPTVALFTAYIQRKLGF